MQATKYAFKDFWYKLKATKNIKYELSATKLFSLPKLIDLFLTKYLFSPPVSFIYCCCASFCSLVYTSNPIHLHSLFCKVIYYLFVSNIHLQNPYHNANTPFNHYAVGEMSVTI